MIPFLRLLVADVNRTINDEFQVLLNNELPSARIDYYHD